MQTMIGTPLDMWISFENAVQSIFSHNCGSALGNFNDFGCCAHTSTCMNGFKCSWYLGVTSCPPSRTPYTHDVRIFYISSLSMLFDICEQCWYQRCVTSIEMGGDVLALGIRFI